MFRMVKSTQEQCTLPCPCLTCDPSLQAMVQAAADRQEDTASTGDPADEPPEWPFYVDLFRTEFYSMLLLVLVWGVRAYLQ